MNTMTHSVEPPSSKGQKAQGKTERKIRILAVDDEPVLLKVYARILGKAGYDIHIAESGEVALEAFKADRFDLVLSDFNMPGMNGLELLKALKTLDPSVRMVTVAGGVTPEQKAKLREQGVISILDKPIDSSVILAAVESALRAPFAKEEPMADNIIGAVNALARILYVDDDMDCRDTMADLGAYLGFNISTAANGNEALDIFMKSPVEVIVSDLHMPGMNGLALLQEIKAIAPRTQVIIVSGEASREERQALLDAGAFQVLRKPVELALLASTVNEALAESTL
jgi:DNA-binding NtrC family response regulator